MVLKHMENLTLRRVVQEAPAAAPIRNSRKNKLLSTAAFLRYAEELHDMKPVLAIQGKGHADAGKDSPARMGRHFIVAAKNSPIAPALFLLNGHHKHRRAHIGMGYWHRDKQSFLIGHSVAIQRWKSFEEQINKMLQTTPHLDVIRAALQDWTMSTITRHAFVKRMAKSGYTSFVDARPAPYALLGDDPNALETAFDAVAKMREGNLAGSAKGRRNIKGVRRPDGLFHAGLVAMAYITAMAIDHRRLNIGSRLPDVAERLPRP